MDCSKLHSTPAPEHWTQWPAIPTKTSHRIQAGKTVSAPHVRTLALQVYPALVNPFSVNSFGQVINNICAPSSSWKWTLQDFVDFPCSDPRRRSDSKWAAFASPSLHNISEPVLTNNINKDGIRYLVSMSSGTDWSTLASTRQLTIALFPALKYLERVICVNRCIIAVLCGEARICWTTPELFYNGLSEACGRNRRHSADYNFVDTPHDRDFHRVNSVEAGSCLYVRAGTFIQIAVQAGTMLALIFDVDVEPTFESIQDWITRRNGEMYFQFFSYYILQFYR